MSTQATFKLKPSEEASQYFTQQVKRTSSLELDVQSSSANELKIGPNEVDEQPPNVAEKQIIFDEVTC